MGYTTVARGVHGHRRVLFMNAEDMVERGWKTRQNVSITSPLNGEKATIR